MLRRLFTPITLLFLLLSATVVRAGDLPQKLAAEVGPYTGSRVMQSYSDSDGLHAELLLGAGADTDAVMHHYSGELKAHGWKQKNMQQMGPIQAAEFTRGKQHFIINIMRVQEQLTTTLSLSER